MERIELDGRTCNNRGPALGLRDANENDSSTGFGKGIDLHIHRTGEFRIRGRREVDMELPNMEGIPRIDSSQIKLKDNSPRRRFLPACSVG